MQARTAIARQRAAHLSWRLASIRAVYRRQRGHACPLTIRWIAHKLDRSERHVSDVLRGRRTSMPLLAEIEAILDRAWQRLHDSQPTIHAAPRTTHTRHRFGRGRYGKRGAATCTRRRRRRSLAAPQRPRPQCPS
jgi:hypothetical protein